MRIFRKSNVEVLCLIVVAEEETAGVINFSAAVFSRQSLS